ncbi:LysR family transcriptional regulator [Nocardia sp. CC227C]|uniref:LysR family transcriptional regulator n=1 Tax=Nocardia sp. CC227C TaxID=3044562 RepID=UPI00278BEE26|nr:LysR family transcriptional regulator [Nocardia sp. CC227C]
MDLRDIEILLTLADELHFGRTAQRLHLSQARISQSVKNQERRIGGRLVDRSNPRRIALTPLGRQLASELRPAYGQVVRAIEGASRTARGDSGVLRVGFMASTTVDDSTEHILASFGRRRPGWRVRMHQVELSDPTAELAAGRNDACLLRVPFPGQGRYRVEVIRSEDKCVALPASHRLAAVERIAFSDLWDEPVVAMPAAPDSWRDHWLAVDAREGHPVHIAAVAHNPEEFLVAVAGEYGVGIVPAVAAIVYRHPGVVYRPVDGLRPTQIAVVSHRAAGNPVVDDFVSACLEHRTHAAAPITLEPANTALRIEARSP